MSRATEDTLADLHSLVAQTIADKLRSGEATSADLSVAIKFLKDNNISCSVPERNDDIKSILDELPTFGVDSIYEEDKVLRQ